VFALPRSVPMYIGPAVTRAAWLQPVLPGKFAAFTEGYYPTEAHQPPI